MFMRSLSASALLLTLVLGSVGCVHVKPYEREYMTRPGMDQHDETMEAHFDAHVQGAREGAVGGGGVASDTGGGCGCN